MNFVDEIALKALESSDLFKIHKKDPYYEQCKRSLEAEKEQLHNFMAAAIEPGLKEKVTLLLGKSKLARLARKHLNQFDQLNQILNSLDDAYSGIECVASESGFVEGFKAGLRFNADLRKWSDDEPN